MGIETASYWTEIKQYEEILGNNPASYCFVPLAELYRKMNLLDDALAIAEKGCDRYPALISGQLVLGKILLARGHTVLARRALETVVAALPDCGEAQRLLGQLYMDAGEYEAARKALQTVFDLDPADTECRLLIASLPAGPVERPAEPAVLPAAAADDLVDEELEEIELLEELNEEVIDSEEPAPPAPARDRPAPLTTATMAELYVQQGFIERAMGIYREILADEPEHATARQRLAELETLLSPSSTELQPAPSASAAAVPPKAGVEIQPATSDDALGTLQQWLTNIGRIREWRSKKV